MKAHVKTAPYTFEILKIFKFEQMHLFYTYLMYIAGVVFMFVDQVGYCTWEPIAFRMGNDFMPTEYRAFSVMAAAVCSEILTFIGSLAFPYGDKALGSSYFYILGAIGNLRNDQLHINCTCAF